MKKIVLFVVSGAIALGIAWHLFTDGTTDLRDAGRKAKQAAQDAVISGAAPDDVAALAMKVINMTQGENGVELWRLKADWGNMLRNKDTMELEKPNFTYYMPPDNEEINITANKGEIEQELQKIRFVDSVVATYGNRTLHAPVTEYTGKAKEVLFPEGAMFMGESMTGKADKVVWHLGSKIIEASGNVNMTFTNDTEILPGRKPDEGRTPPANGAAQAADAQG